jgi:hypothetical protein
MLCWLDCFACETFWCFEYDTFRRKERTIQSRSSHLQN